MTVKKKRKTGYVIEKMASFGQERIKWFDEQIKERKLAEKKAGLFDIDAENEKRFKITSDLERKIIAYKPKTSTGMRKKAQFILVDAEECQSKDSWDYKVVKSLTDDILSLCKFFRAA